MTRTYSNSDEALALENGASASPPNLTQYINIADYTYSSGGTPFTQKLQKELQIKPLRYQGKIVSSLNNTTGFYGEAFITTGSTDKKVIIGFEGTNLVNPPTSQFAAAQIADDLAIYNGVNASSYSSALAFTHTAMTAAAAKGIAANQITLAGHSLGAAEVEYVATQTGLGGTSFGTPGIPLADSAGKPASQLTNYVEYGDPVGNYSADSPNFLSSIVTSSSIRHYGSATLAGPGFPYNELHAGILIGANIAYASKTDAGIVTAGAALAYAADNYHPLGTYAADLNVPLYLPDRTTGSDANFFSELKTSLGTSLCFASGTLIATDEGDIPVEALEIGARAITAFGDSRRICWIGHRVVDFSRHPNPSESWPVCVRAGAFGTDVPQRDVFLSPGHPVLVATKTTKALVPIMCLINGTSIERIPMNSITYWHIELDQHDILLAEGLPAESFLDLGNRAWFGGADGALFDPDLILPGIPHRCLPVAIEGALVEAERRRLDTIFAARLFNACAWPEEASSLSLEVGQPGTSSPAVQQRMFPPF